MTDRTPPPGHEPDADEPTGAPDAAALDALDEAASATLDGQPIDGRTSLDDDLLAARVEELSAVTALLATPVTPPEPSVVDAHVAAALAELAPAAASVATESAATSTTAGPAVVPFESRRRRPAVGRWLAVAAAIAVIALAIPVVQSLSKGSSKSSTTAASVAASDSSAGDAVTSEGDASSSAEALSSGSTTTVAPAFNQTTTDRSQFDGDIGAADDPVEMAALVHENAPGATDESTTQTTVASAVPGPTAATTQPLLRSTAPACDDAARAHHPGIGPVRYTATATYRSIPVVATVYEVPDPTTITYRLIVSRIDTCEVLLDLPYP